MEKITTNRERLLLYEGVRRYPLWSLYEQVVDARVQVGQLDGGCFGASPLPMDQGPLRVEHFQERTIPSHGIHLDEQEVRSGVRPYP